MTLTSISFIKCQPPILNFELPFFFFKDVLELLFLDVEVFD